MKKLLLGTTALVGASVLMAGAAYAAKPTLKVGAYVKFEILASDQDLERIKGGSPNRGYGFVTDSEVTVTGSGTTDAGMKWLARVEIETDTSANNNTDETWVRFSGSWGQINLGSEDGAEDLMQYHSSTAHKAGDGGVDGDFYDAIDWNAANSRFAAGAKLSEDTGDDPKITYFTPRVGGLQAGVSFTPDLGGNGRNTSADDAASDDFQSSFGFGVNFVQKFGGAKVQVSAVGHIAEHEDDDATPKEELRAWAVGAAVNYGNWAVGGSYQDVGDGGEFKSVGDDDATSWNAGVGYSEGPVKLGLSYIHAEVEDPAGGEDEADAVIFGVSYSLGGGASVYGDFFWFDTDSAASGGTDNDGVGFLIGTAVRF